MLAAQLTVPVACPVEGGNIYFNPETGRITGADKSVTTSVTLNDPDGVLEEITDVRIFAAAYAEDAQMERVLAGTISGTTASFAESLDNIWQLFLLDGSCKPLCQKLQLPS